MLKEEKPRPVSEGRREIDLFRAHSNAGTGVSSMVAHFHHSVLERAGQDDICQGCPGLESNIMSHEH